jgi:GNAT superfamily N-acetyltransferase
MEWTIKKAESQERNAIIQLLKESFSGYWTSRQPIYTEQFWNWLYRDNPAGGAITFVAESQGKVVGHFPNVLERLKVGDGLSLAGMVLHLTTHRDFRRRGIFKALGQASWEELCRQQVPYSIAFPNDRSRPGFINKLGFSSIATLPLLIKPLRPAILYFLLSPLGKLRRVNSLITIEARDHLGPEFDSFWMRAMSQAQIIQKRDRQFLNWRFKQRPNQGYQVLAALRNKELLGYIVTREVNISQRKVGVIMDYLVLPGRADVFRRLLHYALEHFRKQGLDLSCAACMKNNIHYKALRSAGFIRLPSRLNPRKLILVGRVNQDTKAKDIFLDKRSWFLSFADWDVF